MDEFEEDLNDELESEVGEDIIYLPEDEYEELLADSDLLQALMEAGVENWEGYPIALEILNADIEDEQSTDG